MRSCFTAASVSRRGGRSYNEDNFGSGVSQDTACWVLADGLGGHGGGADASALACEAVLKSFHMTPSVTPEAVRSHIAAAHQSVLEQQAAQSALARMRTTIVVLIANATHAVWGHVGDTRLYQVRAGRVVNQTKDHSVPQSLVDAGEITLADIRHHEDRSRLLRSLGEEAVVRSSIVSQPVALFQGDAFLLCSDGFWENVYEVEMELDFAKSAQPSDWLGYMENRLQVRVDGSHDNYSAFAVMGDGLPTLPSVAPVSSVAARPEPSLRSWPQTLMQLAVFVVIPVCLLVCALLIILPRPLPHIWVVFTRSRPGT